MAFSGVRHTTYLSCFRCRLAKAETLAFATVWAGKQGFRCVQGDLSGSITKRMRDTRSVRPRNPLRKRSPGAFATCGACAIKYSITIGISSYHISSHLSVSPKLLSSQPARLDQLCCCWEACIYMHTASQHNTTGSQAGKSKVL